MDEETKAEKRRPALFHPFITHKRLCTKSVIFGERSISGAKGGTFAILKPNDTARRVMWTTGLEKVVPVADDEQAAIAAVS